MIIKILAAISAVCTAVTVIFSSLAGRGADLIWLCPLLLLGFFAAVNVLYALMIFIGTELTIDLKKPNDKPSKFWSRTLEDISDWLAFYGRIRVHITGMEKLPEGKFLMVCNHRSAFDPIVMIPIFKKMGMVYVSKPSNFKIPIGGKLMHAYGCLSLNRDNNREALVTINRAAEIISSDKASVCIYPEGTRSREETLLPFHAGSFKVAQKAKCPIVIATIHGTDRVEKNFPLHGSDVYFDITDVYDRDYVKAHKTSELAEMAQKTVQEKYDEFGTKEKAEC